ncbi:MAG: hypothetical protein HY548_05910 [Elusimicrobia bacterium]|nr:hypothetical protein [Elusimicrobiota bacterium]
MNRFLVNGQYSEATGLVQKSKESHYGKKNAFLYYLDLGMLLHLEGKHVESNAAFEQAKLLSAELFTKSITTEASTFLVSDNMRPYYGEDFERALIHVFSALNYIFLGEGREALVEARQVDFLLTKLQTDFGHKNIYTEDAFIRYLMGLIYEDQGEINDAYVSYWKALEAYDKYRRDYSVSAPKALVQDALRTAKALGFQEEVRQIQKRWGGQITGPQPKDAGEVVVLHYNGLPPRKIDSFFEIGFFQGWGYVNAVRPEGQEQEQVEQAASIARSILADEMIRLAFPKYERSPYQIKKMAVRAEGTFATHEAEVAEDIGAIAVRNLQDRIARIRAKTIARAAVKYALSRKIAVEVQKTQGEGMAWLTKKILQVANTATELADKRTWQTVPDQIDVARVVLPAGNHNIVLVFEDEHGNTVATREMSGVSVAAGKRKFLVVRTAQ